MEYKSGRGGARAGAGSPKGKRGAYKEPENVRERVGIRLPAYMVDWLKEQPFPAGRTIEDALLKAYKYELSRKKSRIKKFGFRRS